ncbi:Gfo/Idh/MocA family protein [Paenibacillus humicola]|uniref:Gfo/Idh/MocA family protein n=1 Tax=Paenibacillus humicola TaxID=3110540 RepID=UPI00237B14F5|nr:Gfo/Idh/MocA family oxidoreductase [Paenibacillus humicola]
MSRKVKLGIIGCGGHMFEFLYNTLKWAPPVTTAAVCDADEARLERFASVYNVPGRYMDYNEMLAKESLDAVLIAINETVHYDAAKAAMLAGAHVFVEKTPAMNTQQALELADTQRRTGRYTMVGFNRRYMTAYAMAKEISSRSEFGGIRMYQSHFNTSPYRDEAFFKINHVIHHIDLARFMLGEIRLTHVERVSLSERMVGFAISLRSEGGAIGTIQSGSLLDELYPMERLELIGSRRNIVVDNVKSLVYNRPPVERKDKFQPFTLAEGGDALVWNPSHGFYPRISYHGYEDEIHHFISAVAENRKPEPCIDDSVETMRLLDQLEALLLTAEQGV